MHFVEGLAIGVAFGVFCPSLARKLKALFVKEAAQGSKLVDGALTDVKKKL